MTQFKSLKPELLAPAGSLEKLYVAVAYGADALFLSGQQFGLRQASDNFSFEELEEGLDFCRSKKVKTYITLNSFFHDKDFDKGNGDESGAFDHFLSFLKNHGADALIISDLGVLERAKPYGIPIHLSTQASCLNSSAAKFWRNMGVKRLILGRETSIMEAAKIKNESQLEVELFIHGSMCMAYSGNCVISNFTSGRDSNRGGCAHSCRFEYKLDFGSCAGQENAEAEKKEVSSFFMSSKDLRGLEVLPDFFAHGIDSVKIEGRMKGPLYAATISKIYREALDTFHRSGAFTGEQVRHWNSGLEKMSHRDYSTASLMDKAGADSIFDKRENEVNPFPFAGTVIDVTDPEYIIMEAKTALVVGDRIEFLPFQGEDFALNLNSLYSLGGKVVEKSRPGSIVKISRQQLLAGQKIETGMLVRKHGSIFREALA